MHFCQLKINSQRFSRYEICNISRMMFALNQNTQYLPNNVYARASTPSSASLLVSDGTDAAVPCVSLSQETHGRGAGRLCPGAGQCGRGARAEVGSPAIQAPHHLAHVRVRGRALRSMTRRGARVSASYLVL